MNQEKNSFRSSLKIKTCEKMSSQDTFDFTLPTRGPRNVLELEKLMSERGIANDDKLEFNEDFVEQFYDDADNEPGEKCMFNGDPCVWGFYFWVELFLLAYYYPTTPSDDVKRAAFQKIDGLRFLLPCKNCTRSFRKNLLEIPVEKYLDSRESLIEFCIEMRHAVDSKMGKEPFDVDAFFKKLLACQTEKESHHEAKEATKTETIEQPAAVAVVAEPNLQEKIVIKRSDVQKIHHTRVVESKTIPQKTAPTAATGNATAAAQKTSYGLLGRQVNTNESLKTVRDAIKRSSLNNQQKANLQKLARSKTAKQVEKPGECKTCGGKPKKPSTF